MIKTTQEMYVALAAVMKGKNAANIKSELEDKESATYRLARIMAVYHRAQTSAPRFGLIGVGAISFAESRIQTFQRRAIRKGIFPKTAPGMA